MCKGIRVKEELKAACPEAYSAPWHGGKARKKETVYLLCIGVDFRVVSYQLIELIFIKCRLYVAGPPCSMLEQCSSRSQGYVMEEYRR